MVNTRNQIFNLKRETERISEERGDGKLLAANPASGRPAGSTAGAAAELLLEAELKRMVIPFQLTRFVLG